MKLERLFHLQKNNLLPSKDTLVNQQRTRTMCVIQQRRTNVHQVEALRQPGY